MIKLAQGKREITYNSQSINSEKIGSINGLRGIAILMVIYQHSLAVLVQERLGFTRIIGDGWIGVNLFFILSGFVLYRPYYLKQRSLDTAANRKWFFTHRAMRLYPLFLINCLVALFFTGTVDLPRIESFFLTITTFSAFTSDNFMPVINIVLWSLVIEIWFSILFPFLLLAFGKYGVKKSIISVFLIALSCRFAGAFYEWDYVSVNPIKDSFIARFDDFVLGVLIVRWYYSKQHLVEMKTITQVCLFISGVVVILLGCLLWDLRVENSLPKYYVPFLNNILQLGFGAVVVASLKPNTALNKFFSNKILQLLGLMCFSLYVWHTLLLGRFALPIPFPALYIVYLISLFALASLSYRYVEFGHVKDFRALFMLKPKNTN